MFFRFFRMFRLSWLLLLAASPQFAFATPLESQDASGSLTDPLELSPRVDVAVNERASVPMATLDAIASLAETAPVTHVPSLVPPCDTFEGAAAAASCSFVSWFADEADGAPGVTSDEPIDRPEDATAVRSAAGPLVTEPANLAVLGIGVVAGILVVRWRWRKRRYRRRTSAGGPKVFA